MINYIRKLTITQIRFQRSLLYARLSDGTQVDGLPSVARLVALLAALLAALLGGILYVALHGDTSTHARAKSAITICAAATPSLS